MKTKLLSVLMLLWSCGSFAQESPTIIVPPNAPFQKEFGHTVAMADGQRIAIGSEFEEMNGTVCLYQGNVLLRKISGRDVDPRSG